MKILFYILLFICSISFAQDEAISFGGGEYIGNSEVDNCLSPTDRANIQMRIRVNADSLRSIGKLGFGGDREDVEFGWVLQSADALNWNSYFGISNFVDQNLGAGLGDHHCDSRTYNGHKGTDIVTWPFPWYLVENDLVEVIAGEAGVIIEKDDGFQDDHCSCIGSWNAVYIQHADGSIAWYGHMKKYSLTDKEVGDAVEKGEFLGIVASSGCSTGPHLHLEVYDADVHLIDPFEGSCNELNATSWWESQLDNRVPTMNTLLTHFDVPEMGCPSPNEHAYISNEFEPGGTMYTGFYFHDALAGTTTDIKIRKSDGTIWQEWSFTASVTYNLSWWYWGWTLPTVGPYGVWTLEADYGGEHLVHEFNFGVYAELEENKETQIILSPNPANSDIVKIEGLEKETTLVAIYNSTGKKIKQFDLKGVSLDVSELAEGIYHVVFHIDSKIITKKLVIVD